MLLELTLVSFRFTHQESSGSELPKWIFWLVTTVLVWFLGRLMERSKTRTKEALEACKHLRALLSEWVDAVRDAVHSGPSADATLKQFEKFMCAHNFEPRLKTVEAALHEEEQACRFLLGQTALFHAAVLQVKGRVSDLLPENPPGSIELHRGELLNPLEKAYKDVDHEIERAINFLRTKRARIIPWLGEFRD